MIGNERRIFESRVSKESKRYAWGRQTAFYDILEEDWDRINRNEFFQNAMFKFSPRAWIGVGLDFVLGVEED